jgi:hypothetical protein
MSKTALMGALLAGFCGLVAAQAEAVDPLIGLRGEWKRAGAGFACIVAVPEKLRDAVQQQPEALGRACQHIGPFVVGDDANVVTKALGRPHRTRPLPNGQTAWVYFLEQRDHYPYLVVNVVENRIQALQVTGPAAAKDYGFNRIDLGMPMETLLNEFGQPAHLGPSEEKGTEVWSYGQWPFSFEVRDGHVSSIRISKPE